MVDQRGTIPGVLMILLGAWLLARNLGLRLPGLDQLWPGLLVLFGLTFLVQHFLGGRREHGLIFIGVGGTLLGAFFLAITLGPLDWADLGRYWPVFLLIAGAAFFAQWLGRPGEAGLRTAALLAVLVGLVALVFTIGSPVAARVAASLWPIVLIMVGLALVTSYVLQSGSKQ